MKRNVITYMTNTQRQNLQALLSNNKHYRFIDEDGGGFWLTWSSVPVRQYNNHSVAIVQVNDEHYELINKLGFDILAETEMGVVDLNDVIAQDDDIKAKIALCSKPDPIRDPETGLPTGEFKPIDYNLGVFATK